MSHTIQLAIGISTLALAACSPDSYPPVEILYSASGRIEKGTDGRASYTRAEDIPLRVGQGYGWCANIRTNKPKVKVIEQVTVAAPTTWGSTGSLVVSEEGRTAKVTRERDTATGVLCGAWSVGSDDPPGPVQVKVTIEEKVELQFKERLIKS